MSGNFYELYVDGSCYGNPGKGGIGVYLKFPEEFGLENLKDYRGYHNTTNNRMELRASISGLKIVRTQMKIYGYRSLSWYTDSSYVADYLFKVDGWRRTKWIRSNGEPVWNKDLWKELSSLSHSMQISPEWIPREENKEADILANLGSKNPTHTDFGYNPGKVGSPLGKRGKSPNLFEENRHVLVRIYKGDGMISGVDQRCKIRFEVLDYGGGNLLGKYYAYTNENIYTELHRGHEYILNICDGNIIEIIEDL